jgi:hypothetical protein
MLSNFEIFVVKFGHLCLLVHCHCGHYIVMPAYYKKNSSISMQIKRALLHTGRTLFCVIIYTLCNSMKYKLLLLNYHPTMATIIPTIIAINNITSQIPRPNPPLNLQIRPHTKSSRLRLGNPKGIFTEMRKKPNVTMNSWKRYWKYIIN